MEVSFKGIGQWCATFLTDGTAEGSVVKISGAGSVSACGAEEPFCGVVICGREDAASVQLGGFARVGYSGELAEGYCHLAGDGSGGVKVSEGGKAYWVAAVDSTEKRAMILL